MALIESAKGVPGSLVISGVEQWVGVGCSGVDTACTREADWKVGMMLSKAQEAVEGAKADGWWSWDRV